MQRSWRQDHDKLTFIICSARPGGRDGEKESMIGDVNLFLFDDDNDDEDISAQEDYPADSDSAPDKAVSKSGVLGEVELMIASKEMQGQGYGRASLLAFLRFVLRHREEITAEYWMRRRVDEMNGAGSCEKGLRYLRAKIGQGNGRSLKLFESVGFARVGEGSNYFGEVELRMMDLREEVVNGLIDGFGVGGYREVAYAPAEKASV